MKLYHFWLSSCSWRVRAALAAKGLEVELEVVDISAQAMQQDSLAYSVRNPMRQVPTLVFDDGGVVRELGQSTAIIEYLEERYPEPALLPKEPWQRARARQVAEMVNSGIQPLQNIRILERVSAQGGDSGEWAISVIDRGLQAIESVLASRAAAFCMGDVLGFADLFVYPQIYNAQRFNISFEGMPTLARIAESCAAHPAFIATHPDLGAE
ncbi:MAG: maleylacetoacetate isomerase [Myxococcales bacterium]|nr:maleylacetoacetate isomerase [Myxococcales bacterium]